MKIGELAKRSACDVQTIRYYERAGLLPAPPRTDGNYREYREADATRLVFIRHCRSLNMSLDDIRALQNFQTEPGRACGQIEAMLDLHLLQTEQQMQVLQRLQAQLQSLRNACLKPLNAQQCGILQNLNSAADSKSCACHA